MPRTISAIQDHCAKILDSDPEKFGDLQLEVAEALMTNKYHDEAIPFLKKLVHSQEYGKVRFHALQ